MSQPTAPETLGSLTDETTLDPNSKASQEIAGKSPMQIALGRLMRDKIAVVCFFVVLFFVLSGFLLGRIFHLRVLIQHLDHFRVGPALRRGAALAEDGRIERGQHPLHVADQRQ